MLSEKVYQYRRQSIVLRGMGGIGKSQIALEYIYQNLEDYNAVFWIDASSSNAVNDSGRKIMNTLITHYAKINRGSHTFQDVAIDLDIPGQITSDWELSRDAAVEAWKYVQNWLAKDGNRGWCIIVDGLNYERDAQRVQALLPKCAYGHVIITSRVPVHNYRLVDVPVLDRDSGPRLLLQSQTQANPGECNATYPSHFSSYYLHLLQNFGHPASLKNSL